MAAIIDSAPDCVTRNEGGENFAEDGADFILQDNYVDCAGFGTFMPGSTYGEDGSGAESIYMILDLARHLRDARRAGGLDHLREPPAGPPRGATSAGRGRTPGDLPPQPGGVGDTR